MKLQSAFVILLGSISASCAGDHDTVTRLTARVAELEGKVAGLSQSKPPATTAAPAESDPPYESSEAGWSVSGGGRDVYEVHLDRTTTRDGHPTARLAPVATTHGKYGTWARTLDATPYLGKRVRFSMYAKTQGTTQRADFWARVQAHDSPGDGPGLGGHWTSLPADSDWAQQQIVLDVDRDAAYFNYGVGIAGPGVLWFDLPTMEVVGNDVPVTPTYAGEQTVNDWLMTGVGAPDFKLEADARAVRIERAVETSERFVAVVRAVPAAPFVGKRAKAAFDVRTDGLDSEGLCILKVQAARDLAYGGFLAIDKKPVPASTKDFVHCNLEAVVPTGAKWILYGFTYRGRGKAWARGGSVK